MSQRLKQLLNSLASKVKDHPKTSVAVTTAITIGLVIRYVQRKIIYLPKIPGLPLSPSQNPFPYRNPNEHQLDYEPVEIKTSDNVLLKGWYVKGMGEQEASRIILYYHENAGNIGARLPFIKYLVKKTRSNVIIVAYRGYSDSNGTPSETGIKRDGASILQHAIQKSISSNLPLVVFGRSLGGAVAINSIADCKQQEMIKGIILENTFTSISDVAGDMFGFILTKVFTKLFLFFLLSNHWQSYRKIGLIKSPVFFIKSGKDELIPKKQMDKLQMLCTSQKSSYTIQYGTHNETWCMNEDQYFQRFNGFLSSL